MKRRHLLYQLPACLAAPALAQAPAGPELLVVLTSFAKANVADIETATRQELARLGWRVGENLHPQFRYAEIPFDQPTRAIPTLNRDTARSIGWTFPQELLLRADEVVG
jgi:hypothetical protein